MPVTDPAHLNPVMAALAGTADAAGLDLLLVAGRGGGGALGEDLDHQFRFYGLRGALLLVPDHETLAGRLDAGLAMTEAPEILVWQTSVMPRQAGWLARLRDALAERRRMAAISPMLTYEDGSVHFGGSEDAAPPRGAACALVGFERRRVAAGAMRPAPSVPAQIALIDRDLALRCGGFRGSLWGDRFLGQDLGRRLGQLGARAWCDTGVEFWMFDAAPDAERDRQSLVDRIDAALVAHGRRLADERTPGDGSRREDRT